MSVLSRANARCLITAALLVPAGVRVAVAQHPQVREGFWISFGVGYGSADVSCNGCGSTTREGSATAHIRLGGTLNPRVLLGGEVNAWTKEESGETITIGNVSAAVYYYPQASGGLFIKGGAGFADLQDKVSGLGTASGTGVGLILGGGYDVRVGRRISLTPVANWYFGSIGEVSSGGQSTSGLDWKQNVFEIALAVTFH